ncbi:MAG: Bcr/CflA subfamily drug resistance transporter [Zhongshania aliphaticivorans]|jgi:Bcr/CflA subfamily drug resistance transporter|uniref:Bcr/CflA family efflux transporter n=1 Tax=Zhongshania aliphaticivorans TaxID=1470434 RepID=A0A127M9Y1_9GAMM|nr:multidrug effflux MFS transporter [Zhongshania aliphaticivorans]AMO69978.1 MFS transporter [Zhongshania aliphaticivorans]
MNITKRYENYIVFLAPLINSVAGIAIDLYAPSIPSIGLELDASPMLMKNTITITLVCYAIGQLFFGIMADSKGRRSSILFGMLLFIIGSVLATTATSIEILLVARGIQGFAIGACQVVARAILVDNVKGDRFRVAIIYLSLAFGIGPIVAPYIGGVIEVNLGWRYNFVLYAIYGAIVLAFICPGLKESLPAENTIKPVDTISSYSTILKDSRYRCSVIILGTSFSAFLIWNVIGPYIIQERLGHTADYFGKTALAVGLCYFVGTLLNRVVVKRYSPSTLMWLGGSISLAGVVIMSLSAFHLSLVSLLAGIMVVALGQGFIFSNALAISMSLFPDRAGVAASLQGCLMLICGALASALASYLPLDENIRIASFFLFLMVVSLSAILRLTFLLSSVSRKA